MWKRINADREYDCIPFRGAKLSLVVILSLLVVVPKSTNFVDLF